MSKADTIPGRPMIRALTGIRGIAAAWVVLFHFRVAVFGLLPITRHAKKWLDSGYLGVDIFFILSGFVISHVYTAELCRSDWRRYSRYLEARLARLYPVHLLFLLVLLAGDVLGIAKPPVRDSAVSFIGNVLMLQAIPPFQAWNGPSWSITYELGAYALFPLLAFALIRISKARSSFACAAVVGLLGAGLMALELSAPGARPYHTVPALLRITSEFAAGGLLHRGWSLLGRRRDRTWDVLALAALCCTVACLAWVPENYSYQILVVPLLAFLILACVRSAGPVAAFLESRVLQWSGRISYSLYMTHFTTLNLASLIILRWQRVAPYSLPVRIGALIAYMAFAITFAHLVYRFVEEPARRRLRRWFDGTRSGDLLPSVTLASSNDG
ncbi:acyltransferase family protein [Streptomyces sp. NPDC020801]|uniref:acyltransferase family protein n=1 Tax=Streptomyces sp. NPDC020801 TaxID=3365093 RepID=UPI00379D2950